MKHIIRNLSIISAFAAVLSCNQNDGMDYWSFATGDQEIEFTPKTDADTKGVITGTAYPENEPFAVTAWYLGADASDENKKWNDWKNKSFNEGGPIQYIPAVGNSGSNTTVAAKIERDSQTRYWKNLSSKFYWPAVGSLTFCIYSPYSLISDSNNSNLTVSCTPSEGLKILNFDVTPAGGRLDKNNNPVAAGKQWNVDFMVTPLLENYTKDSVGAAVNAVFKHQLSTIQFYTKRAKDLGDDIDIYLKEISIKRVLSVASYSMYKSDNEKWERKGQNAANEESEYLIFQSQENNGKGLKLTGSSVVTNSLTSDDPILVIPQILPLINGSVDSTTATIVIKYTKVSQVENPSPTGNDDLFIPEIREAEYYGDFKSIFDRWSPNKSYSYTLSIGGLETIHWDPSVSSFSYKSTVLRPEIFDKDGQVSDDVVLALVKQDTVNKYNGVFSKYGNYNFQVNEDCQGDIRDNLYFMWYQLRRPKSYGDEWVYPYSYSKFSYNWYASIEGVNGTFKVNTNQQMDPYSLFKQVCGVGESPYNTTENCRNNVVFQLKKSSTSGKFYIYHPVTKQYLKIDFSKGTNGIGNSDCASFVSNMDAATPLSIDFIGVFKNNLDNDGTTDGVQIYYDTYTDVYGTNDGTSNGIISKTYNENTKQHYYVLGVDITRTFQRNYITFENGTISFRTVSKDPVHIEKQYLYVTDQSSVDITAGWAKAHTEVGKLLSSAGDFPNLVLGSEEYNDNDNDYKAIMNLIPLNGTIKTEQKIIVDNDSLLTDFELRNIHGNADTYGSSKVAGQYKFGDVIKVTGDVYAKYDGNGPGLIEKDVELTVTKIAGEEEGVLYGKILTDGTIEVVSGGSPDGHALVNCTAQLLNHPKYGSITPSGVNYVYDGYDKISYALVLNPVEVNSNETETALGTVYYVYNGNISEKPAEKGCAVTVTAVGNTSYASVNSGKIKGGNVPNKVETTYNGTYTYTDNLGAKYTLTAKNGKLTVHSLTYNLVLNPVEITAYYPNNNVSYSANATGSVYKVIDGVQQSSAIQGADGINVTIASIGNSNLATGIETGTFTANTGKKYGKTTYTASYNYNGTTVVSKTAGDLTVNVVEYEFVPNSITVRNETLEVNTTSSSSAATGTLYKKENGGTATKVDTYGLVVTGLASNQTVATLSSNVITAWHTGSTTYSYEYTYTDNSTGYSYKFTGENGTLAVTAEIKYTLTLGEVKLGVGESEAPTATLKKEVNDEVVSSNQVSVSDISISNTSTAYVNNNNEITGRAVGETSYTAKYTTGKMGVVVTNNPAKITVENNNNLWEGEVTISTSWNDSKYISFGTKLYAGESFTVEYSTSGGGQIQIYTQTNNADKEYFSASVSGSGSLTFTLSSWNNGGMDGIRFAGYNYKIKKVYKN